MSEDELDWYNSDEGMQAFIDAISPRLVGVREQFSQVAVKLGFSVSPIYFFAGFGMTAISFDLVEK